MTGNGDTWTISFLAAVPYRFGLEGRTQRLAWHLAAAGHHVHFVAPPTPRAMLRHWIAPWRERRVAQIELVWPLPIPMKVALDGRGGDWATRLQSSWLRPKLCGTGRHVLCVSSPAWASVVERLDSDLLVYDCIDDPEIHARSGKEDSMFRGHKRLCANAGLVVAVSQTLANEMSGRVARPVVLCGNGVDVSGFVGCADSIADVERHSPQAGRWLAWRREHREWTVAGYVGGVDRWVDVELIARLARAAPEIRVLVAGPVRRAALLEPLRGLANVDQLGRLTYEVVPAVMAACDVGVIPFVPGRITAAADPLKLYEFFALGKPVVGTYPFRKDAVDQGLLTVAEGSAFVDAVREACQGRDDLGAARRQYARDHDWAEQARQFRAAIGEVLGERPSTHPGAR